MKVLVACEFSGIIREAFARSGHDAWSCDLLPTEIPGQHIHCDVLQLFLIQKALGEYSSPGYCAKQTTLAVILNGERSWVGSNWCKNPQSECPRKGMPTGIGYDLCKNICKQNSHAEEDACLMAGDRASGGILYLIGHYYCCDQCKNTMARFGIAEIRFLPTVPIWDLMIAHPPCTYLSYVGNKHWNNPGRAEKRVEAMHFFMSLVNAPINKICVENPLGLPTKEYRKYDQIIHPYYWGEPVRKRTCLWLKNLPLLEWDRAAAVKPKPLYICQGEKCKGKKIHWVEGIKGSGKNRSHERSRTFQSIADAMAEQWGTLAQGE